ncbi:hypothetical protein BKM08_28370, partial [Pseudomonas amygdali pv. morsprunorum]
HHFHADHPVFSCSESEQKQLNTWVSFRSAEQPLMGQFSVSGNIHLIQYIKEHYSIRIFLHYHVIYVFNVKTQKTIIKCMFIISILF